MSTCVVDNVYKVKTFGLSDRRDTLIITAFVVVRRHPGRRLSPVLGGWSQHLLTLRPSEIEVSGMGGGHGEGEESRRGGRFTDPVNVRETKESRSFGRAHVTIHTSSFRDV